MRNYVQPGRTITLPAPYNVASGAGFLVGSIFAIAAVAALQGDSVEGDLCGVYDLPKADSQAWTVGAKVYWDATAKVCTTSAASGANTLIGAATQAVAGAAGLTVGRVRLNGTVS